MLRHMADLAGVFLFQSAVAVLLFVLLLGYPAFVVHTGTADAGPVYTTPEVEWGEGPASLPDGARLVVLQGDPRKEGDAFALRLWLPDGYRLAPHWTSAPEGMTVISGALRLGEGDRFDADATRTLEAGSYVMLPAHTRVFGEADGETVIQVNGVGPWQIHYVDGRDDPRTEG